MYQLYAPWRGYRHKEKQRKNDGCPFCSQPHLPDHESFILYRGDHVYVILNRYPYNPGHLMVIPYRHTSQLYYLKENEHNELMRITSLSSYILQEKTDATGVNIGCNLGDKASGGSIPDHVHIHLVPRWKGDTGFMVTTIDTVLLSENLAAVYDELKEYFSRECP